MKRLVRNLVMCMILLVSSMPQIAHAQTPETSGAESSTVRAYDIPAQDLAQSLAMYGEQTDVDVRYDPVLVQGKKNQPVHGGYRPESALRALLRDTGLSFRTAGDGAIEIVTSELLPQGGSDKGQSHV